MNNAKISLLHDKIKNVYFLIVNDKYRISIEKEDFNEIAYILNINIKDTFDTNMLEQKVIIKYYDGECYERIYYGSDRDIKLLCEIYLGSDEEIKEIEIYKNSCLTCKLNNEE